MKGIRNRRSRSTGRRLREAHAQWREAARLVALQEEISLEAHALQLPRLWGSEEVKFYSGVVPIGSDIFRRIVIRASKVPVINSSDFSLAQWTEAPIYEVCTNPAIYAPFESSAKKGN